MEKKITIELTEDELDSILLCLDARSNSPEVAGEWRLAYKQLADKLQEKLN